LQLTKMFLLFMIPLAIFNLELARILLIVFLSKL